MLKYRLKFLPTRFSLGQLALIFSAVVLLLALPVSYLVAAFLPETVLGIDAEFMTVILVMPVLTAAALVYFANCADDTERHMLKYENE